MIKEKCLLFKLVLLNILTKQLFENLIFKFKPCKATCPVCQHVGTLRTHGYYKRPVIDFYNGERVNSTLRVPRYICSDCGHTCALLPDILIPCSNYSLLFVLKALAMHFIKKKSVTYVCGYFSISRSLFYKWLHLWDQHKKEWLEAVKSAVTDDETFITELWTWAAFHDFTYRFFQKREIPFLLMRSDMEIFNISPRGA